MTLLMRDSDNPLDNLAAVAGYADGGAQWSSEGWKRFEGHNIVPLSIVLSAANLGDILDVESGGASPEDCPGWADRFSRPGRRGPTIYCNRSTIAAVRRAMGSRSFDWWAATLDGTKDVPNAVAVQYCGAADSQDPCRTSGHYDESVILDESWIGEGHPVAPPQPEPTKATDHWWGPYVEGADQVVELGSRCHAPVFQTGGHWFRNTTVIGVPQIGEFAEWTLANRVNGVWFVMDESGGTQSQGPMGRLPVERSFWVDDSVTRSTGCGGTNPVEVALSGKGHWYVLL
jgi:hypothetical protein